MITEHFPLKLKKFDFSTTHRCFKIKGVYGYFWFEKETKHVFTKHKTAKTNKHLEEISRFVKNN